MSDEQRAIVRQLADAGFFVWVAPGGAIVAARPSDIPTSIRIVARQRA